MSTGSLETKIDSHVASMQHKIDGHVARSVERFDAAVAKTGDVIGQAGTFVADHTPEVIGKHVEKVTERAKDALHHR